MANLYNMLPVSLKNEQSFKLYLKRLKAIVYDHNFTILLSLKLLWRNNFADASIDVILCVFLSFLCFFFF
jgi:hypothetical protein